MMSNTLLNIVSNLNWTAINAFDPGNIQIREICVDTRMLKAGDMFVAVKGVHVDGHEFVNAAIEKGAAALVLEYVPENVDLKGTPTLILKDTQEALGYLAANFYGHPSQKLKVVAITGTNGKTSTTTLLWQLFTKMGMPAGLIGTVENRVRERIAPATLTTPDPITLQRLLREMLDDQCAYVFMEASSHAIDQARLNGIQLCGAVFTNITHDHLDYHKTFAHYRDTKKRLFDNLPANAFALTNTDDKNGAFMMQNTKATVYTYGLKKPADFKSKIIENALNGLHLHIDQTELHTRMIGEFNAYNLTAAFAVARLLGVEKMEALTALSNLPGAEGRFEYVIHPNASVVGIVDYAHTPDALEKVLETINQLKKSSSRVITVVGCGGDRDKSKRPIMAQVSVRFSDMVFFTSDNPRTEDPNQILRDMETGLDEQTQKKVVIIENRAQAIKAACKMAQNQDIVLVAGKGHEKYQEIGGIKHPFDDKAILMQMLETK